MEEKIRPDMIVTLHTVSLCLCVCVCDDGHWSWLHKDGKISARLGEMAERRGTDMKPCEAARAFLLFGDMDLTVHSSFIFL